MPKLTAKSRVEHPYLYLIGLGLLGWLGACTSQSTPSGAGAGSHSAFPSICLLDSFDCQGHRGARGLAPENTLPAFELALKAGMNTLELDVVVSADSQLVVSHEPWLSPTICRIPGLDTSLETEEQQAWARQNANLFQLPYADIRQVDCGSKQHPQFPEQQTVQAPKPLLSEVLSLARAAQQDTPGVGAVQLNIETKSHPQGDGVFHPQPAAFARLLHSLLEAELSPANQPWLTIQSFDPRTLEAFAQLPGELAYHYALLVDTEDSLLALEPPALLQRMLERLSFQPHILSPHHQLVTAEWVAEAHAAGIRIIPWTVNDPVRMEELIAMGVDGLITDYPNRLYRVNQSGIHQPDAGANTP